MTKRIFFYLVIMLIAGMAVNAIAGETATDSSKPMTMATITVREKLISPTKQEGDLLHTGSKVTTAGIELSGNAGLNSVFKALDLLPGINTELQDPFGISGKDVRIRGIKSMFAGMSDAFR